MRAAFRKTSIGLNPGRTLYSSSSLDNDIWDVIRALNACFRDDIRRLWRVADRAPPMMCSDPELMLPAGDSELDWSEVPFDARFFHLSVHD